MKIRINILFLTVFVSLAVLAFYFVPRLKLSSNQPNQPEKSTYVPVVITPPPLESCDITKAGNPLVASVEQQGNETKGFFKGIITKLVDMSDIGGMLVTISDEGKRQSHPFLIRNDPGLVADQNAKTLSVSDLAVGQSVTMEFFCQRKEGNLFQIRKTTVQK